MTDVRVRRVAKLIVAAASIGALAGCFHIPQRALANGRQLGYGTTQQVLYGEHNPTAQRQLYNSLQSSAFGYQVTNRPYQPQFKRR
jgi:hypothetical protein